MKKLMAGRVYWSYDYEVRERSPVPSLLVAPITWMPPFHVHEGEIILTDYGLFISGDTDLTVPFDDLEVHLGFDETFPRALGKNLGLFWQPLRLRFTDGFSPTTVYLIIDYNWPSTNNELWFKALKEIVAG